ncbi:MAG: hypothetical protein CMA02_05615, partial [Euryarchaeota archaeon]|nr:hypothetical protein [Euryarchaeota archaeon]
MRKKAELALVVLILFQIPIYFDFGFGESNIENNVTFHDNEGRNSAMVEVEIENGRHISNYTIVAFPSPLENRRESSGITLVQDDNLGSSCYEDSIYYQSRVWGIWDHLSSEIKYREMDNEFTVTNTRDFLRNEDSNYAIFPYSNIPEESQRIEFLSWIRDGGILFSMADFFSNIGNWEGGGTSLGPLLYGEQLLSNPDKSFHFG